MKCTFFLFVALLVALALATSPLSPATGGSDIVQTSSAYPDYIANGHVSLQDVESANDDQDNPDDEPIPSMDDLVAELGKITKSNATLSSGPFSNFTTEAWDDWPSFPDMTGRYAIDMFIGKEPTHVGSMSGSRLYNTVYQKLRKCGIAHKNPSIPGFCNFERPECYKWCAFGPIGYRDGKNGYKTDSDVRITTKYSYFEEENNPGIQDLTFRMMARVIQAATEEPNNCRMYDFDGYKPAQMCSIPSKLLIAYPTNGGVIQGILNIEINWTGKTGTNTFDCESTKAEINSYMMWEGRTKLKKLMGWPGDKTNVFTACVDDNCFAHKQYRQMQPWKPGPKCRHSPWPMGCGDNTDGGPALDCPSEA